MSKYLSDAAVWFKWTGGAERRITPSELIAESAAWLCGVSGELCPCELLVLRPVDRHGKLYWSMQCDPHISANIFNILCDPFNENEWLTMISSPDRISGCFAAHAIWRQPFLCSRIFETLWAVTRLEPPMVACAFTFDIEHCNFGAWIHPDSEILNLIRLVQSSSTSISPLIGYEHGIELVLENCVPTVPCLRVARSVSMAIGPTSPCRLGSRKGLRALDAGCIEEFLPLNQSEIYHMSYIYIYIHLSVVGRFQGRETLPWSKNWTHLMKANESRW